MRIYQKPRPPDPLPNDPSLRAEILALRATEKNVDTQACKLQLLSNIYAASVFISRDSPFDWWTTGLDKKRVLRKGSGSLPHRSVTQAPGVHVLAIGIALFASVNMDQL